MRKSLLFFVTIIAASFCAKAQVNIQEQYDFNREHLTTTLEMFKADKWGSTFFFTDIYHPDNIFGPTGYYTEIARGLNFWQNTKLGGLSAHVEWNGGQFANNAWLFGAEYLLHSSDFRYTLTIEVMYKSISGQKLLDDNPARPFEKVSDFPMQFTIIWGCADIFGLKGLTFSGFADFWGENINWGVNEDGEPDNTKFVFVSEPQLWYNIGRFFGCDNLNIGGEVELAYNFAGAWRKELSDNKGFNVSPCLGVKWNF